MCEFLSMCVSSFPLPDVYYVLMIAYCMALCQLLTMLRPDNVERSPVNSILCVFHFVLLRQSDRQPEHVRCVRGHDFSWENPTGKESTELFVIG
jgi:hypothetical protein